MKADNNNHRLKFIGWNPNGIRSLFKKNAAEVQRLYRSFDPDIVIWNEIKGNQTKYEELTTLVNQVIPNQTWLWNHAVKAGRHGVAVSVKPTIPILSVDYGFGDGQKEEEGRLITLQLECYFVIGIYGVNAGMNGNARLDYKIQWIKKLLDYMNRLKSTGKHVIVMGDWNIAPTFLDVHNPISLDGAAGFTSEERSVFSLVEEMGWVDVFRRQNPNVREYSFFSGRNKQGKKVGGWRIDHAVVDDKINLDHCQFKILVDYDGSDHVPIFLQISDQPIKLEDRIPLIPIVQPVQVVQQQHIFPQPTYSIIPMKEDLMKAVEKSKYYLPTVVRIRQMKDGTIIQGCDVYIGRQFKHHGYNLEQSIWANPFKPQDKDNQQSVYNCLVQYEAYIRQKIVDNQEEFFKIMFHMVSQGRPLTLGCFCKDKPTDLCHGDIVQKILAEFILLLEKAEKDQNKK